MGEANEQVVTGSLELEERDLRAAVVDLSGLFRARLAIALIIAASYGSLMVMGGGNGWGQNVQLIVFGVLFVGFLWVSPALSARRLLRAIAKGGDRHASYRFDAEGVTIRTAGTTSSIAYRSLVESREGKTALLLYVAPNVANIVPKRAFSDEDLPRVRLWLAENVKAKRVRSTNRLILVWIVALFMFMVIWQFLSSTAPPQS